MIKYIFTSNGPVKDCSYQIYFIKKQMHLHQRKIKQQTTYKIVVKCQIQGVSKLKLQSDTLYLKNGTFVDPY